MVAYTIKDNKRYFVASGEPPEIWDIVAEKLKSLNMSVVVRYSDGYHVPESWFYLEELVDVNTKG